MKVLRILQAWYYWLTNRNDEVARRRLLICGSCDRMGWGICKECGCPLQAKARLLDEQCPHPKGDKWHVHNFIPEELPGDWNKDETTALCVGYRVIVSKLSHCECGAFRMLTPYGWRTYKDGQIIGE